MKYRCPNPYCAVSSDFPGSCDRCYGPMREPIHGSALTAARENLAQALNTDKIAALKRAHLARVWSKPRKPPAKKPYSKPTPDYRTQR